MSNILACLTKYFAYARLMLEGICTCPIQQNLHQLVTYPGDQGWVKIVDRICWSCWPKANIGKYLIEIRYRTHSWQIHNIVAKDVDNQV